MQQTIIAAAACVLFSACASVPEKAAHPTPDKLQPVAALNSAPAPAAAAHETKAQALGFSESKVEAVSYGKEAPRATCHEEQCLEAKVDVEPANSICFDSGSTTLDPADTALIAREAELLRDNPDLVVTLRGYVDDLNSSAYGLAVGQKRLEAVRTALLSTGIPLRRIRTEIHADEPEEAAICENDDCRKHWRRVEMHLAH